VAVQDQRADRLADLLSPRLTRYNAAEPLSVKQQVGLLLSHIPDVLFGGAAGGGKSSRGCCTPRSSTRTFPATARSCSAERISSWRSPAR
jgi:hypothetical protein